jgi:hypothetical protein
MAERHAICLSLRANPRDSGRERKMQTRLAIVGIGLSVLRAGAKVGPCATAHRAAAARVHTQPCLLSFGKTGEIRLRRNDKNSGESAVFGRNGVNGRGRIAGKVDR